MTDAGKTMYVASLSGPSTSIKAIAAALACKKFLQLTPDLEGLYCWSMSRFDGGYECFRVKLGYYTWHLLALARCPGLIRASSDEALWQTLQAMHFTTPRLREWTPWLRQRLEEEELLLPLNSRGCAAAVLRATTDDLDQLVTEGLQAGKLRIA